MRTRLVVLTLASVTALVGAVGAMASAGAILTWCDSDAARSFAPAGATNVVAHPPEPPWRGCAITYALPDGGTARIEAPTNWSLPLGGACLLGVAVAAAAAPWRQQARIQATHSA